jgi:hypothetical protein
MVLLDTNSFITCKNEINREKILNLLDENKFDRSNTKFIVYHNDNKYIFNTKNLNIILQDIFNPIISENENKFKIIRSNNKYENSFAFRLGDNVIRTENDYVSEKMRANGEEE